MSNSLFFDEVLKKHFGDKFIKVYETSQLLQYLSIKTKSVDKSSKSRANLANLYAIFVLVEDYIKKGYNLRIGYANYEGANFSALFKRQRELPYGQKLQNHGLNNRCNDEFRKFFQTSNKVPIIRDLKTQKYWINESLLIVELDSKKLNIAEAVIDLIQTYITLRTERFSLFFKTCLEFQKNPDNRKLLAFIEEQLKPETDARIFEIVSFCILRSFYAIKNLELFKTGRTNANDGGIDMVMRPSGRFFQVSEVLDFKKYFLDIEKTLHYPITFVIKSKESPTALKIMIIERAKKEYDANTLNKYINSIEEIISIPTLISYVMTIIKYGNSKQLLDDLILYYKIEFNIAI